MESLLSGHTLEAPAESEEAGYRLGSRRSHPEEAPSSGYAETGISTKPYAPPRIDRQQSHEVSAEKARWQIALASLRGSQMRSKGVLISTIAIVVLCGPANHSGVCCVP